MICQPKNYSKKSSEFTETQLQETSSVIKGKYGATIHDNLLKCMTSPIEAPNYDVDNEEPKCKPKYSSCNKDND